MLRLHLLLLLIAILSCCPDKHDLIAFNFLSIDTSFIEAFKLFKAEDRFDKSMLAFCKSHIYANLMNYPNYYLYIKHINDIVTEKRTFAFYNTGIKVCSDSGTGNIETYRKFYEIYSKIKDNAKPIKSPRIVDIIMSRLSNVFVILYENKKYAVKIANDNIIALENINMQKRTLHSQNDAESMLSTKSLVTASSIEEDNLIRRANSDATYKLFGNSLILMALKVNENKYKEDRKKSYLAIREMYSEADKVDHLYKIPEVHESFIPFCPSVNISVDKVAVVMEFGGETLKSLIEDVKQNKRSISFDESIEIYLQIAYSIANLNENKVTYCDLKPENIVIGNEEVINPKLIDFGALVFDEARCKSSTIVYAPPEFKYNAYLIELLEKNKAMFMDKEANPIKNYLISRMQQVIVEKLDKLYRALKNHDTNKTLIFKQTKEKYLYYQDLGKQVKKMTEFMKIKQKNPDIKFTDEEEMEYANTSEAIFKELAQVTELKNDFLVVIKDDFFDSNNFDVYTLGTTIFRAELNFLFSKIKNKKLPCFLSKGSCNFIEFFDEVRTAQSNPNIKNVHDALKESPQERYILPSQHNKALEKIIEELEKIITVDKRVTELLRNILKLVMVRKDRRIDIYTFIKHLKSYKGSKKQMIEIV